MNVWTWQLYGREWRIDEMRDAKLVKNGQGAGMWEGVNVVNGFPALVEPGFVYATLEAARAAGRPRRAGLRGQRWEPGPGALAGESREGTANG